MATMYEEGAIVSNDKGEKLRLTNGEWIPEVEGPGEVNKALSSVAAIGKGLLDFPSDVVRTGATLSAGASDLMQGRMPDWASARQRYSAENNPVVGALAAPGRMLQQGVEAAGGNFAQSYLGELGQAIGDEVGPLSPAAQTSLDVLGVGAGFAAPGAGRAAVSGARSAEQAAANAMRGVGGDLGGLGSPMMMVNPGGRMSERMANRLGAQGDELTGTPKPKVYAQELPPQWFDDQGIPITPAQRALLNATSDAEVAMAKRMKWAEDVRGVGPEELAQQRIALNNIVKSELGMEGPEALTRPVLSDIFAREGAKIGELTSASGPIAFDGLDALKAVAKDADTPYKGSLNNIVKDVEASLARNDGHIMPQDFQNIRTRLVDMAAPGNDFGKASKAGKMLDKLEDALEKGLNKVQQQELRQARYRYKIASALERGAAIGNDGFINPASFGKSWDKGISKKLRGKDIIGQAAGTMNLLQRMEANTGTTLQRVIGGAINKAPQTAASGLVGAAGLQGIGSAAEYLFNK